MFTRINAFAVLLLSCYATIGSAQQTHSGRATIRATAVPQSQAGYQSQTGSAGVSGDLLTVYERTKTAKTEEQVTVIARACANVISDNKRSTIDRDYAESLLAWALNRRGEIRNETAAQFVEKGQLSVADKLDRQAAEDFETALEYGPVNWRIHHNFAISLAMRGDYQQAIESFTRALKLKPEYSNAHFNRGELYFELGQYPQAIRDYDNAIALNAEDPQYYNSRGHCYFMLEAYDKAMGDYRKATELGSDSAVYHTDLADAHQFLGEWEQAAKAYRAAVAINARYPRAYQNAAWLMATCPEREFRNVELAITAAKKSIELGTGKTSRSLDTLAAATAATGKFDAAAEIQREALTLAAAEERSELAGRLQLYQQGQAYVQPQPVETLTAARQNAERASTQPAESAVRTASGRARDATSPATGR